jgi:hypothetical protein
MTIILQICILEFLPFVKGGQEGFLYSLRKISPVPSLEKRGTYTLYSMD